MYKRQIGGYLLPEVLITVIFLIITAFTEGAGAPLLVARLTAFVSKMRKALAVAGKIGPLLLKIFAKLDDIVKLLTKLTKALRKKVDEVVESATDVVTKIVRGTKKRVPPKRMPHHRKDLGDEWYDPETGDLRWPPNDGFDGKSINDTLKSGQKIDRYSRAMGVDDTGSFLSPQGAPFDSRALPYNPATQEYAVYEVVKPIPVQSGIAAPWFGQTGGATQYMMNQSVGDLVQSGYLRQIK